MRRPGTLSRIVSGGQTGADRAALDVARVWKLEYGGYVPAGRQAEDGRIPDSYAGLVETSSAATAERTRLNVEHSDGTLIVSHGPLTGGSRRTQECAVAASKPWLHVDLNELAITDAVAAAEAWLTRNAIATLNVAGPRASEDARAYAATAAIIDGLLARGRPPRAQHPEVPADHA